jgi:ABC-type cobalamin/Fe3+-siderophores transport system ATPase subunit
MLKVDSLSVSVDSKPILKGLSLDVPAGEVHAIMGPNGAGKSKLVNGFVRDVLQHLPMEFAVEAQKLVAISLEGSVG